MMADDQALQGPSSHLANGSRGRSQVLPYQPHGFTGYESPISGTEKQPKHEVFGLDTVVSKLITDRDFFWGDSISNYRYRIALPEELIAITETDLWELQQEIFHYRYRFSLEFQFISIRYRFRARDELIL